MPDEFEAADLPKYITEGPDGALTVELVRGIEVDGATVRSVTFREPSVDDQLAAEKASKGSGEAEITFLANLAGLSPAEIRKAKMRDYKRMQEVLSFFYG